MAGVGAVAWNLERRCEWTRRGGGLMDLHHFQAAILKTYGEKDSARGIPMTIAWIAEEVGELAQAVRKGSRDEQMHEFGDVLAWLASLASQLGISLEDCVGRFAT